MDFEIDWNVLSISIVLWLVFIGLFIYLPRFAGGASYFSTFGKAQTIGMFALLLPISYFVVWWQSNR